MTDFTQGTTEQAYHSDNTPVTPLVGQPTVAGPQPTIRLGSKGPAVIQWQNVIGVTPDGNFGPKTRAATIAWQKKNGLTADGVVGAKTWSAALAQPVAAPDVPAIAQALQQAAVSQIAIRQTANSTQQTAQAAQQKAQAQAVANASPITASLPAVHSLSVLQTHPAILRYGASILAGGAGFLINPIVGGVVALGTFFIPKWRT